MSKNSQLDSLRSIVTSFFNEYNKTPKQFKVCRCWIAMIAQEAPLRRKNTPKLSDHSNFLQVLDLFCVCAVATALLQFVYALLVGTFPFNAFLAGFFCCIGSFVLTCKFSRRLSGSLPFIFFHFFAPNTCL